MKVLIVTLISIIFLLIGMVRSLIRVLERFAMATDWEPPFQPSLEGEIPFYCDEGPFSHIWTFEISPDGYSLINDECEQCHEAVQSPHNDIFAHLGGAFQVKISPRLDRHHTGESEYFIDMDPL